LPLKLKPVIDNRNLARLKSFLDRIRITCEEKELKELDRFTRPHTLQNNDLVFIGNRVFLYVVPLVIESQLKGDIQGFLKTVQLKKNIK
jgi:hypothetical protein